MLDSPKQKQLLGLGLLLVIAFVGIRLSTSRPRQADVDIRFAGYHTNAAGLRVVRFDLQNNGSFAIERSPSCTVLISSPIGWWNTQNYMEPLPNSGTLFSPGTGELLEIPVPNTTNPWRLGINYSEPRSRIKNLIWFVRAKLGISYQIEQQTYSFQSEVIQP
jgi:hypothetical protein